jgi:prepilin-type N-terminal cleavage/methylation domain-containing protein
MEERNGFTLIEVVVAIGLLAGGLLAVAHLSLVGSTAARNARRLSLALGAATTRMEQLHGLAWGYDVSGTERHDVESDLSRCEVAPSGGRGLSPSPADALLRNTDGYADFLDANGLCLASVAGPPAGAVFERRWSVTAFDAAQPESLLIQVGVFERQRRSSVDGGRPLVTLAAIRTRRAN